MPSLTLRQRTFDTALDPAGKEREIAEPPRNPQMSELSSGPMVTATFLFTDIEGSTRLLERFPHTYGAALLRHDVILRRAVASHHGRIFETIGDAVYAVFPEPAGAVAAALAAQEALGLEAWGEIGSLKVRMALHTGEVERRGRHYFGPPLYRCARMLALIHGGQVILSSHTAELVRAALPPRATLVDLGEHHLRDLAQPERLFQLASPDLPGIFPPLRTAKPSTASLQPTETREQTTRWKLLIHDPHDTVSRIVPLVEKETTIGRDPACTLQLESPFASRHHARIDLRDDGPWFADVGSHNGSQVNGVRIDRPALLRGGDVIAIADTTLECLDQQQVNASPTRTLDLGRSPAR
jgi:class 3 adenylate cyclase